MKKIAIIGYNLFSIGGTTRNNINQLKNFVENNFDVFYFNFTFFNQTDIRNLLVSEPTLKKVHFREINDFFENQQPRDLDIIIISRESLFPLSELLRSFYSDAVILGEIHTPLALLKKIYGLKYFTAIRVATKKIKKEFESKYHYQNVFVKTVNANHICWSNEKFQFKKTNNFLISSRFSEDQKDIIYALKIFCNLKKQGYNKFHLYLMGTGPDKKIYQHYIKENHLQDMITFTKKIPENYIYLSTAKYETFGYSIMETIAKGHLVIAYVGDDFSIKDIYNDFPSVFWIKKENILSDAKCLIKASQTKLTLNEYRQDKKYFDKLTYGENYNDEFNKFLLELKNLSVNSINVDQKEIQKIKKQIQEELGPLNANLVIKIYHYLMQNKLFGNLIIKLKNIIKK